LSMPGTDIAGLAGQPEASEKKLEPLVECSPEMERHPDWDDYRAAMIKTALLIRITPTKAGPTIFG
jgi:hypothetical protein